MTLIDIIVVIALAIFFFKGFQMGLVRGIGVLIGLIVGLWIAGRYYEVAGNWLVGWGLPQAFSSAGGYIVMFIIGVWVISIIVFMADRVFKFLAIVPGMKLLNNVLGGVLFLIEGVIMVGVVLFVIGQFSDPQGTIGRAIDGSRIAPMVKAAAWVASPLIPASIEQLKNNINANQLMPTPDQFGNFVSPFTPGSNQ